jgi:hypothetical protein
MTMNFSRQTLFVINVYYNGAECFSRIEDKEEAIFLPTYKDPVATYKSIRYIGGQVSYRFGYSVSIYRSISR